MGNATRVVASFAGVTAGLLGMEHGYFEVLQGNTATGNLVINAFGPPCQADKMWHACEPAMTVIPNFLVTGLCAMIVSLVILIWAAALVQRKHGGAVLIFLSVVQLLIGGGFVSPLIGIIAGFAGTRIHTPLAAWRVGRSLATLWPWSLIVYLVWLPSEWILGAYFNETLVSLSGVLLLVSICLLLLAVFSGLAYDKQTLSTAQHTTLANASLK